MSALLNVTKSVACSLWYTPPKYIVSVIPSSKTAASRNL